MVVKCLVERPMTFAELMERLPMFSLTAVRAAVWDLSDLGYVSDDSAPGRQRRSKTAYYSVNRDLVSRDVAELLLFLSR